MSRSVRLCSGGPGKPIRKLAAYRRAVVRSQGARERGLGLATDDAAARWLLLSREERKRLATALTAQAARDIRAAMREPP